MNEKDEVPEPNDAKVDILKENVPQSDDTKVETTKHTNTNTEDARIIVEEQRHIVENEADILDNVSIDNKFQEIDLERGDIAWKRENQFILTHVVAGHIIQESNIAFPIRQPARKKKST